MFLRQYSRKKSGKVHRDWALVESLRTEEGPRQRVVAHLGEFNHSQQRRWQRTIVFYNRHGDAEQLRLFADDPGLCLCVPTSEFALAEPWYASTGLEDLLGIVRQRDHQGPVVPHPGCAAASEGEGRE